MSSKYKHKYISVRDLFKTVNKALYKKINYSLFKYKFK